jgi:hypothetical protein
LNGYITGKLILTMNSPPSYGLSVGPKNQNQKYFYY